MLYHHDDTETLLDYHLRMMVEWETTAFYTWKNHRFAWKLREKICWFMAEHHRKQAVKQKQLFRLG